MKVRFIAVFITALFGLQMSTSAQESKTQSQSDYERSLAPILHVVTNHSPIKETVIANQMGWDTSKVAHDSDLISIPYKYAVAPYVRLLANGDMDQESVIRKQLGF